MVTVCKTLCKNIQEFTDNIDEKVFLMKNKTLSISEGSKLLGVSTFTIRRYLKKNILQGELAQGRNGQEWRINRNSLMEYLNNNGNGKKSRKSVNAQPNNVLIDYGQLFKELQGAYYQIGGLKNQIENYERMLTAGDTEKQELNHKLSEITTEIDKRTLLVKRYKAVMITTSALSIIFLGFAIAGIILF